MQDRVLITAIDSFTGKHLANYLRLVGYEVVGTSLFGSADGVYTCDITNKEQLAKVLDATKPAYIIHLAAISYVAHSNTEAFYRVNAIGGATLLQEAAKLQDPPKRIILASSAAVYGNQTKSVLDESLCPNPTNHYGLSKYALEQLAYSYKEQLPIVIARPFNYTGIGQSSQFLIPKIISHFKASKPFIELGNLDVVREFNDISFVCEAYRRLLTSPIPKSALNIASGRGIRLLDVIDMMQKIAGYEIEVRINKAFVRTNEIKKLIGSPKLLFKTVGTIKQPEFAATLKTLYKHYPS